MFVNMVMFFFLLHYALCSGVLIVFSFWFNENRYIGLISSHSASGIDTDSPLSQILVFSLKDTDCINEPQDYSSPTR